MISWRCIFHGHEIIRYDRELAWECIGCFKKWPMAPELVRVSGVYAQKGEVIQSLSEKGHRAYAPTLPGHGPRRSDVSTDGDHCSCYWSHSKLFCRAGENSP
jgi:hypothetical protein